ncbi:MAG: hypothetical protein IPN34_07325 [Planctomycetes bacterium]|nr:hypothetical protein [Planctomycetota bacterium]
MHLLSSPRNAISLVGFAAYVLIRGVWIERRQAEPRDLRRVDALERALLALVFLGSLLAFVW